MHRPHTENPCQQACGKITAPGDDFRTAETLQNVFGAGRSSPVCKAIGPAPVTALPFSPPHRKHANIQVASPNSPSWTDPTLHPKPPSLHSLPEWAIVVFCLRASAAVTGGAEV